MQAASVVPLRRRLLFVAIAGVVPVALAAGLALWAIVAEQWRSANAKSLEVTRLAASAIDVELQRSIAALTVAAASPSIDYGNLREFQRLMQHVLDATPGWRAIYLTRPDGTMLLHSGAPLGALLPSQTDSVSLRRVAATRQPAVGQLKQGAEGSWDLPVRVPVIRDGQLVYVLTGVLTPDAILRLLHTQRLPADWIVSVFDANGRRIARTADHARTLGTAPSPSLQRLMEAHDSYGIGVTQTLEGTDVYSAFVRMPVSGWSVAIGIPTATVSSGAWRAFAVYGGGIVASLVLALLWAGLTAARITRPIAALRATAASVGRGEPAAAVATDIQELRDLGDALIASGEERRRVTAELLEARDSLQLQVADLERLHRLANELLRTAGLEPQLRAVLAAFCELQGTTQGLISLSVGDGDHLEVVAARGFSAAALERLRAVEPGEGACGMALRDERRVVVSDTETDPTFAPYRELARAEGFRAVHSTPIRAVEGRVLGVLSVHGAHPGEPTARQMRLADLCAHLCAIFIERAQAESVAAESERRLAVALDSSAVPFGVLAPLRDNHGVIVDFTWEYANRAAATGFGLTSGLVGRRMSAVAPELGSAPGVFEALVAAAESGRVREVEAAGVGPAERCFQIVATPSAGKLAVWSADVTDRRRQERALQAADRRKDQFLAVLAHELRNPLAPIQQAAMITTAPNATTAQKHWSQEVIVRQVKHMALLLEDLLDVSRITRGKLELRMAPIELRATVEAAIETARPHVDAKGHVLTVDLPEAPIQLMADPLRVAQVVTNLLTNAARYTPAGGRIRVAGGMRDGTAWITVEDDGAGIDREHLDDIFEMFAQGASREMHGGGLGIGLALSRGIAQLHGGTLTAASEGPNRGSRFTLSLPLASAPQAASRPAPEPVAAAGMPLRVLVADDNRDASETLASLLRLSGHSVVVAYDGPAALREYGRWHPDVVILDIGMPQLSGYTVAQRIRELATPAEPPALVALTGWGQARDRARAAEAGFDHHLTKPVEMRELFAILGKCRRRVPPFAPQAVREQAQGATR